MCILKWFVACVVYYKLNRRLCSLDKISDLEIVSTLSSVELGKPLLTRQGSKESSGQKERTCIMALPSWIHREHTFRLEHWILVVFPENYRFMHINWPTCGFVSTWGWVKSSLSFSFLFCRSTMKMSSRPENLLDFERTQVMPYNRGLLD